jgi:hypothetical protein
VILLVLVVVLWILVLTPSLYRRFAERDSVGSIDHFHRSLNTLEHAGPKLVNPAYRLHTAMPGGTVEIPAEPEMYRAKLVLLRPVDDEESADIDDDDGVHYERVGVLDPPEPPVMYDESRAQLQGHRRQQARRRRSSLLLVLTGLTFTTAILGTLPALRLAWVFTVLTGLALLGVVGLIAYARQIEGQTVRFASPAWAGQGGEMDGRDSYLDAAASGYPGAWDEDDDYPRQAAGGS